MLDEFFSPEIINIFDQRLNNKSLINHNRAFWKCDGRKKSLRREFQLNKNNPKIPCVGVIFGSSGVKPVILMKIIDKNILNELLARFIHEVQRKDGNECPPLSDLLTLSAHAREGYSSHFVCQSVSLSLFYFGEGAVFRVETYISTF